jgi:hypothetical protein
MLGHAVVLDASLLSFFSYEQMEPTKTCPRTECCSLTRAVNLGKKLNLINAIKLGLKG